MTSVLIPPGFIEQRGPKRRWWMKVGWETAIQEVVSKIGEGAAPLTSPRLCHPTPYTLHPTPSGGRGAVQRVPLETRGAAIVRHYRRGGLVRHFVRDLYWDRPPRPFAELLCTETARQRGVPTVEVLAAGVEWTTFGLYRGVFITREAEGFINLWEWLRTKPTGTEREAAFVAVVRTLVQLCQSGVAHADLNLTNILVQTASGTPQVLIIDFDRARLFPGPLPPRHCTFHIQRLCRSLDKLDPEGQFYSPAEVKLFRQADHTDFP
jgi:hypothetical protein